MTSVIVSGDTTQFNVLIEEWKEDNLVFVFQLGCLGNNHPSQAVHEGDDPQRVKATRFLLSFARRAWWSKRTTIQCKITHCVSLKCNVAFHSRGPRGEGKEPLLPGLNNNCTCRTWTRQPEISLRHPRKSQPIIPSRAVDIVFCGEKWSLCSLEMMDLPTVSECFDKYTGQYEYIRAFIGYLSIQSHNVLFHRGRRCFVTLLTLTWKLKEFSCQGAFSQNLKP